MTPDMMNPYSRKNPPHSLEPFSPEPGRYRDAVVIPVLAEEAHIDATLSTLHEAEGQETVLKVLVINHTESTPSDKIADNRKLLARLRGGAWPGVVFLEVLAPENGGVGFARKVGCDSVLPWIDRLIFHLDGDTTVEKNYFSCVRAEFQAHPEWSGGAIRFRHPRPKEAELAAAIEVYERYLDSYVAGLTLAKSPYAYHAMGSAMVCTCDAYCRSGGMRVRAGGEDFYFLQALRKVGVIGEIAGTTVHPQARPSDRVPFGTGPRLREIVAGKELPPYPAAPFLELQRLLRAVESLDPTGFDVSLPPLSKQIGDYLHAQNFPETWRKVLQNTPRNDSARRLAFHRWFDAFRTLKFIHGMLY